MTSIFWRDRDPSERFLEISRKLSERGGQGLPDALQALVELAERCIFPQCDWAGVTAWPIGKAPRTPAATNDVARHVDGIQYALKEGPCLDAAAAVGVVSIRDVGRDARWPEFAHAVLAQSPVRAVLSYHLSDHPERMALNLYARRPHAFDQVEINQGSIFAAQARALIRHGRDENKAAHPRQALDSNRQIGIATGILMGVHRINAQHAMHLLKDSSNRLDTKLGELAEYVTETGALPDVRT